MNTETENDTAPQDLLEGAAESLRNPLALLASRVTDDIEGKVWDFEGLPGALTARFHGEHGTVTVIFEAPVSRVEH